MEERDAQVTQTVVTPEHETIWVGRYGLRTIWSLLLFIGSSWTLGFCVQLVLHFSGMEKAQPGAGAAHQTPPLSLLFSHGLPLLLFLIPSLELAKIEKRKFWVYGLGGAGRGSDLLKGALTGVAALSLLVVVLHAMHLLVFDGMNVSGGTALRYGLIWLAGFLLVGVSEEFIFRGYLQYTLTRGLMALFPQESPHRRLWAFWLTAFLLSLAFLGGHVGNTGESRVGLLAVFLAGVVLAYSLWRTGSLWWAIGFHWTWDWAQSFLYGVGDSGQIMKGRLMLSHPQGNPLLSGGATGPEGSVLFLGIFVLLVATIRFTVPKREQPPLEPSAR